MTQALRKPEAGIRPKDRILVGIDTPDRGVAIGLAERLGDAVGGIKLGMEFFNAQGPDGIRAVAGGRPLFLDLKYHDIPNTVAGAVRSAVAACRPMIINIHAAGGPAMMRAAVAANRETADAEGIARPKLIAVTVLTWRRSASAARPASRRCGWPGWPRTPAATAWCARRWRSRRSAPPAGRASRWWCRASGRPAAATTTRSG